MRIDKFLKNSRLVKRRTIAKEACENDRILINGR
ncbi:MAG: S4 domain-containing protein, partial [Eubacteriales bacterium]|nr:S4 domain-containing protein [Eubacteriales bacterium]